MYNQDLHLYLHNNRISTHQFASSIHNSAGTSIIPNHGVRKVVSQTFSQYSHSFHSVWGPYITQDIQIGRLRLEIVVKFAGISLVKPCVCKLVVLFGSIMDFSQGFSSVLLVEKSEIFILFTCLTFYFNLGVKFGTFSHFLWKGGKSRLEQRTQANPSPSQACEPELRPSEPSSSATKQPSPTFT